MHQSTLGKVLYAVSLQGTVRSGAYTHYRYSRIACGNGCNTSSTVDEGPLGVPKDDECSLLLAGQAIGYVGRDCGNECMGKERERREGEEDMQKS